MPIFLFLSLTRPGMEPDSTVSVAEALSTQFLIGSIQISRFVLLSGLERETNSYGRR